MLSERVARQVLRPRGYNALVLGVSRKKSRLRPEGVKGRREPVGAQAHNHVIDLRLGAIGVDLEELEGGRIDGGGPIFSEKVAVRLVPRPTFVAPLSGVVLLTMGCVVSTLTVTELETEEVLPAASVALAK